jgi:hypothetical protein
MRGSFAQTGALDRLRRFLLLILLIGMSGTATELILLNHYEDPSQLIPLVLIAGAFAAIAWHLLDRNVVSLRALQMTMVLFIVAGVLGMYLHYLANMEFQREMDASIDGMHLFWKAIAAKTPPALAPGSMLQLGFIGLAYTYRHPAADRFTRGASGADVLEKREVQ